MLKYYYRQSTTTITLLLLLLEAAGGNMKPVNNGYQTQATGLSSLFENGLLMPGSVLRCEDLLKYQINADWQKSGIPSYNMNSCLISVHLVLNTPGCI